MPLIVKRDHPHMPYYYGLPRRVALGEETQSKEVWTAHRDYAKRFSSNAEIEQTFGFTIEKLEEIDFVFEEVDSEE